MSLDKDLEPDWVDDYDDIDDELDPDLERDRREAEAIEDEWADTRTAYDRWVETHSWPGGVS